MKLRFPSALLLVFASLGARCAGQEKTKREFKLEANSKEFCANRSGDAAR